MINPRFKNEFTFNHGSFCGAWKNAVSFNSTSKSKITEFSLPCRGCGYSLCYCAKITRAERTFTTTNEEKTRCKGSLCWLYIVLAAMEGKVVDLVYVTRSREMYCVWAGVAFSRSIFSIVCKAEEKSPWSYMLNVWKSHKAALYQYELCARGHKRSIWSIGGIMLQILGFDPKCRT